MWYKTGIINYMSYHLRQVWCTQNVCHASWHRKQVISGFRHQVYEICALLRYHTAYSSNSLPKFRDMMGPRGCSETSVRNYHYTLCNIPDERSFQDHYILLMAVKEQIFKITVHWCRWIELIQWIKCKYVSRFIALFIRFIKIYTFSRNWKE